MRDALLEATTTHTMHCPFKGAAYWMSRVGGDERRNAVWSYPKPVAGDPPLAGYLTFHWDAVDGTITPAIGAAAPNDRYSTHVRAFAAHLVFGRTTALASPAVSRR